MDLDYFFPFFYVPSYASSLGLGTAPGATLLALMSVAQVADQFTFGYLSDKKISVNLLMVVPLLVAVTVILSAWGLARSLAPLIVFVLLYSFFGAGYTAMWARMLTDVSEE